MFKIVVLALIIPMILISNTKDIDSILISIERNENITSKLNSYIYLVEELLDNGSKEAIFYADIAYNLADSLKQNELKAKFMLQRGIAWRIWGNNAKAMQNFVSASDFYFQNNMMLEYAETIRNIGEAYRAASDLDKALASLFKAEEIFAKHNDSIGLAKTYNRLAAVYYEVHAHIGVFYNNRMNFQNKLLNYVDYYESVPEVKHSFDSTVYFVNLSNQISSKLNLYDVEISSNIILATLYNVTFQLDKSFELYQKILLDIQEYEIIEDYPLVLYNLGVWYFNNQEYEKSIETALEAYKKSIENDYKAYIYLTTGLIAMVYEEIGDFESANEYLRISLSSRLDYFKNDIDFAITAANYENKIVNQTKEIEYAKKTNLVIITSAILGIFTIGLFLIFLVRKNKVTKKLNEDLRYKNDLISQHKDKLEIANAEKDKFFSIIAHDLKNPIGNFKNITKMLHSEFETFTMDEKKEIIGLLEDSAGNINELLENLLDWSKAQRGSIKFNPTETNLFQLLDFTLNLIKPSANAKNINIINNVPNDTILTLDANIITTIIRNLVTNSIKFTNPRGIVEIGINSIQNDDFLEIFVKDNGIGIKSDTIQKLFKIDQNISTKGTANEKGTGLGLILCQEFAQLHGGYIRVESQENIGSIFYIKLPKK